MHKMKEGKTEMWGDTHACGMELGLPLPKGEGAGDQGGGAGLEGTTGWWWRSGEGGARAPAEFWRRGGAHGEVKRCWPRLPREGAAGLWRRRGYGGCWRGERWR